MARDDKDNECLSVAFPEEAVDSNKNIANVNQSPDPEPVNIIFGD